MLETTGALFRPTKLTWNDVQQFHHSLYIVDAFQLIIGSSAAPPHCPRHQLCFPWLRLMRSTCIPKYSTVFYFKIVLCPPRYWVSTSSLLSQYLLQACFYGPLRIVQFFYILSDSFGYFGVDKNFSLEYRTTCTYHLNHLADDNDAISYFLSTSKIGLQSRSHRCRGLRPVIYKKSLIIKSILSALIFIAVF